MSSHPGGDAFERAARHVPVLLREVLQTLDLQPGLVVVDGTVGAGGHSFEILKQLGPDGRLIGLDRDPYMLQLAGQRLTDARVRLVQASYAQLPEILAELQVPAVDRILLDLGLSSDQLADASRSFSFHAAGPLDLRFDVTQGEAAAEWLQRVSVEELAEALERYGEEPQARRIARFLGTWREEQPLRTGQELAHAVCAALGLSSRQAAAAERHPATQVFQALRIVVNAELLQLEIALQQTLSACLKPGGILAIISFHSLEDRLVKQSFRDESLWEILLSKPVTARSAEQRLNPRSRSAKLRAARKR